MSPKPQNTQSTPEVQYLSKGSFYPVLSSKYCTQFIFCKEGGKENETTHIYQNKVTAEICCTV